MSRASILVVEDNPQTRKLLRVTLEGAGHAVREAESAQIALDLIASDTPRLVLLDLVLPDMDGVELLRRVRGRPGGDTIPVLAISGMRARLKEVAGLHDEFTDTLLKPVTTSRLLEQVRSRSCSWTTTRCSASCWRSTSPTPGSG